MHVLGDLVARERRSDHPALRTAGGRRYSYHDFCTTSYKAGNFLRYLGVRAGDTVAVEPDPVPEPTLTFFGAVQLGAATRFDPGVSRRPEVGGDPPRATVVPVERESAFSLPPGHKLAVYGGSPESPQVAHWEQEVWSENPAFPPTEVDPESPALLTADGSESSHEDLLAVARRVVAETGLGEHDEVAVRGSLSDPGVVAGGVIAPLLAGATVVFPAADEVCDVAVGEGPEEMVVDPDSLDV
ncbi:AMP-binding protein [Salinirubrum litoreum]|uniref:AMP-binding protein n=1 Tax=Salinirubrum litoreum TaxID=1126234 RepID=A0ABD5RBG7_9EURY|nr:AMP-binding protein [Salinirubrum litoreum]